MYKDGAFERSFNFIMNNTSFYQNFPQCPSEDRIRDIQRKHNPEWKGWKVFDQIRGSSNISFVIQKEKKLHAFVKNLYYRHWRNFSCHELRFPLSLAVFDSAMVWGKELAINFLQQAYNDAVGYAVTDKEALTTDGKFGPITYNSLGTVDQSELIAWLILTRFDYHVSEIVPWNLDNTHQFYWDSKRTANLSAECQWYLKE